MDTFLLFRERRRVVSRKKNRRAITVVRPSKRCFSFSTTENTTTVRASLFRNTFNESKKKVGIATKLFHRNYKHLPSLTLTGPQLAVVVDDEPTRLAATAIRLQAENRIQHEDWGDEIRSIRRQPTRCARFYNSRCGRKWKESRRIRRTFEEEEEYIDGFHRRWGPPPPPLFLRRCRLERGDGGGKE